MIWKSLVRRWNQFFFTPESLEPIAVFRILYGLMVTATLLLLRPDWLSWFGPHAWVTLSTVRILEPGTRLNVFGVLPPTNASSECFFWVFLGFAVLLTVGLCARISAACVFLGLVSIHQRNLYITHGGDTFLRLAGFFLVFAPAGAVLSLDRVIRVWRRREPIELQPHAPWAQRMIQVQLSLMYFSAFLWKIKGATWLNGTAPFYVYHLEELRRFPMPDLVFHPWVLKIASWSVLVLEFSLGVLIWITRLRYFLLVSGVLFHLWLEYSLNVPLFQWDILIAYVLFVRPKDVQCALEWGRLLFRIRAPQELGTRTGASAQVWLQYLIVLVTRKSPC